MSSRNTIHASSNDGNAYQPRANNVDDSMLGLAALKFDEEATLYANTGSSGGHKVDSAKYKPNAVSSSPTEHTGFVLKGFQRIDDPFSSRPSSGDSSTERTPNNFVKHKRGLDSSNWRTNGVSGSEDDNGPVSLSKSDHSIKSGLEESGTFTSVNASQSQSIFPPSCCVFVANLALSETDESLEVAVTQAFRQFGPVWVKIRRDAKQMPCAFVQYTCLEHADNAIRHGRGQIIKGRPCRCEKARANRMFFFERIYGSSLTEQEARALLAQFGKLSQCKSISALERAQMNVGEGVFVEFVMYDEGQAAHSAFRNHETFKFTPVGTLVNPNFSGRDYRTSSDVSSEQGKYLKRYELDRRSVFIGNIASGTSVGEIGKLFEKFGSIDNIVVKETQSKFNTSEMYCLAFVEFDSALSTTPAIEAMNNFSFKGKYLRVAPRNSEKKKSESPQSATKTYRTPAKNAVVSAPPALTPVSLPSISPNGLQSVQYWVDGNGHWYSNVPGQQHANTPQQASQAAVYNQWAQQQYSPLQSPPQYSTTPVGYGTPYIYSPPPQPNWAFGNFMTSPVSYQGQYPQVPLPAGAYAPAAPVYFSPGDTSPSIDEISPGSPTPAGHNSVVTSVLDAQ